MLVGLWFLRHEWKGSLRDLEGPWLLRSNLLVCFALRGLHCLPVSLKRLGSVLSSLICSPHSISEWFLCNYEGTCMISTMTCTCCGWFSVVHRSLCLPFSSPEQGPQKHCLYLGVWYSADVIIGWWAKSLMLLPAVKYSWGSTGQGDITSWLFNRKIFFWGLSLIYTVKLNTILVSLKKISTSMYVAKMLENSHY